MYIPYIVGVVTLLIAWGVGLFIEFYSSSLTAVEPMGEIIMALVAALIAAAIMRRKTSPAKWAELKSITLAFVIPAVVAIAVLGVLQLAFPMGLRGRDFISTVVPLLLAFYLGGGLYGLRPGTIHDRRIRMMLPPVVAVLVVGIWISWNIMSSVDYQYRDAFALEIDAARSPIDGAVTEATLEIKKPGNYQFTAYKSSFRPENKGISKNIQWEVTPVPNEVGVYRLKINWSEVGPTTPEEKAEMLAMAAEFEETAILEIRRMDDNVPVRQFVVGQAVHQ